MSRWPIIVAMGLVVAMATPAHGNPADAFGLGGRTPAMGGAGVATTNDTTAGYYNPGALGYFENLRLDMAYQYAAPRLEINDLDTKVDPSRGLAVGLAIPGKSGSSQLGLGITFFLPDRSYSRSRALDGGQPRFQLYDNRPQRFLMSFGTGVTFLDGRLAVGAGISYMSASAGDILLRGRVGFPDASDSDLDQGLDVDVTTTPYYQAGVLYKATDWLTFGASYRGAFELDVDLTLDIRGSVGPRDQEQVVEDGFFTVNSISKDHFQPAQYTVGASAQVTKTLLVAFDLGYYRWSAFNNPATIIDIDLDVGMFNEDIDITEAPAFPDPNFDDIFVPRFGIEWRAMERERVALDVRGGYYYEPSPAPEQTGENNFVDNDKHTVSLGLGGTFQKVTEFLPLPFSLDAYLALTMMPDRTHEKVAAADPVGDYSAGGRIFQLGIGSRWRF